MNEITTNISKYLQILLEKLNLQTYSKSLFDIYLILAIATPVSILAYLIFERYKHRIFVDLGNHKWIIKH